MDIVAGFRIIREGTGVVVGRLQMTISLLHLLEDSIPGGAFFGSRRDGPVRGVFRVSVCGKRARSGLIKEEVGRVDIVVDIASLLCHELEDVGSAIPAAERWQLPVCGQGGDGGVVRIEGVVLSSLQVFWDSPTQEDAENLVRLGVGFGFVESEQNQGVLHEVFVVEKAREPVPLPFCCKSDIGIMPIVGHVWRHEGILGETLVVKVIEEFGEILDLPQSVFVIGDRIEENQGVVFADIIICVGLLIGVVEALITWIRHMLLVLAPRYLSGVKKIGNGRYIFWNLVEVVVVHSKGVTAGRSAIVGLRWVGDGPVVGQSDSLRCKVFLVGITSRRVVVLFIRGQP